MYLKTSTARITRRELFFSLWLKKKQTEGKIENMLAKLVIRYMN